MPSQRKPLHQRSDSQNNELPTIRLVRTSRSDDREGTDGPSLPPPLKGHEPPTVSDDDPTRYQRRLVPAHRHRSPGSASQGPTIPPAMAFNAGLRISAEPAPVRGQWASTSSPHDVVPSTIRILPTRDPEYLMTALDPNDDGERWTRPGRTPWSRRIPPSLAVESATAMDTIRSPPEAVVRSASSTTPSPDRSRGSLVDPGIVRLSRPHTRQSSRSSHSRHSSASSTTDSSLTRSRPGRLPRRSTPSYSAFPPASPPLPSSNAPPPTSASSRPTPVKPNRPSITTTKAQPPSSIGRQATTTTTTTTTSTPSPSPSHPSFGVIATPPMDQVRRPAPLVTTARLLTAPSMARFDGLRMHELTSPSSPRRWETARSPSDGSGRGDMFGVGQPQLETGLVSVPARAQGGSRRDASSPEEVRVPATASPPPMDSNGLDMNRLSTIRVVPLASADAGGDVVEWSMVPDAPSSITTIDAPLQSVRPPRSLPRRPRPMEARESIVSDIFPEWARAYYATDAPQGFDSLTDPVDEIDAERSRGRSPPLSGGGPSHQPGRRSRRLGGHRRDRPDDLTLPGTTDSPMPAGLDPEYYRGTAIFRPRPLADEWSPHLAPDRMAKTLSVWKAPEIQVRDGEEDGWLRMSRRRLQILLFCVGFIIPFAWIIAAFLPLPFNPRKDFFSWENRPESAATAAFEGNLNAIDEKRYDNARWWRNLNRVLSLVGVLVIAVIVTLVIIGSKTSL